MTVACYREESSDRLLDNLTITLSDEQEAYLKLNKDVARTILYKVFNKAFKTHYSKLQITYALEDIKKTIYVKKAKKARKKKKEKSEPRKSGVPNVYWMTSRNKWTAQFHLKNTTMRLGYYDDLDEATKAANDYREWLKRCVQ